MAEQAADDNAQHIPVLWREVNELLAVRAGECVLDCTIGFGGHALKLASAAGENGLLLGLDVDEANLSRAAQRLSGCPCSHRLFRCNFGRFDEALAEADIDRVDVILADLGVCSSQIDDPERGFSFKADGPLDMRLDDRLSETAADLVNRLSESDLADIIYFNAQERRSRRIARAIHQARRKTRITTTARLAEIVSRAMGMDPSSRKSKIHPATRTFQALRIAVNDELGTLETLLTKAPDYLTPGGRIGVISFHSLEDGMVKRVFNERKKQNILEVITKKPVTCSEQERKENPRSRSAKLRVAARTDQA